MEPVCQGEAINLTIDVLNSYGLFGRGSKMDTYKKIDTSIRPIFSLLLLQTAPGVFIDLKLALLKKRLKPFL